MNSRIIPHSVTSGRTPVLLLDRVTGSSKLFRYDFTDLLAHHILRDLLDMDRISIDADTKAIVCR